MGGHLREEETQPLRPLLPHSYSVLHLEKGLGHCEQSRAAS
jgi:hypothetical protein